MAVQPIDALQCFTSISENVPSWITRVTELAAHTSRKHAEFSEEFKKLAQTQQQNPRRRKNSSVHSIRPGSGMKVGRSTDGTESKRLIDVASIASGEESVVVRTRRPLIITYDTHTQKEFEQTVRDIGVARNSLRKGKMSQVMRKSSLALDMFSNRSRDSLRTMQIPADGFRRTRVTATLAGATAAGTTQKESAFEFADKQLEIAQSLCESAAHKFLRCGDCKKELDDIVAKFQIVLQTATHEASRLRAEKEREVEQQQQADGTILLTEQMFPLSPSSIAIRPLDATEDTKPPEPGTATIEVDDAASDSSMSIDITAFRSARFRV